jgi:hypothetical protein
MPHQTKSKIKSTKEKKHSGKIQCHDCEKWVTDLWDHRKGECKKRGQNKPHCCTGCGVHFEHKQDMKDHIQDWCKPLVCFVCGTYYKLEHDLDECVKRCIEKNPNIKKIRCHNCDDMVLNIKDHKKTCEAKKK